LRRKIIDFASSQPNLLLNITTYSV